MIKAITKDTYTTNITSGSHRIIADEPVALGGANEGMNPQELLESSLASCSSITLRMYINRKQWDVNKIEVEVSSENEKDSEGLVISKKIKIYGQVDEKQLKRLEVIASKCPVHKILIKSVQINSSISLVQD